MEAKRVLAIASGGGRWQQLRRSGRRFEGQRVTYVTTDAAYFVDVANAEILSLSGRATLPFADIGLTRWPRLASDVGAQYKGSIP